MDLKIFDRMESEVRGYIRSFPVIFNQARGSLLIDESGKEYIDFFSGAGTLNYGHNNPVFKNKIKDYLDTDGLVHSLDMATGAKKTFLETVQMLLILAKRFIIVLLVEQFQKVYFQTQLMQQILEEHFAVVK